MRRIIIGLISYALLVGLSGCCSVPKEVVELSYSTGKDLVSIQQSYDSLIHEFYENLRSQRRQYLDDIWYPRFLSNWRDDGQLIAIAKKEVIFSVEQDALISTPNNTTEKEHLDTLNDWVTFALYAYETKEDELLKPLNDQEGELRKDVNDALNRLIKANAAITAHLNSLRKVQEVQDDVLKALDLEDLREKINSTLVKASNEAQNALDKIKDADSKIDSLVNAVK